MDGNETSGVEFEKLRKVFLDDRILKPNRFLTIIEATTDKEYRLDVKTEKYDYGTIRFRRWTHEECNRLIHLPFYGKLIVGEPLTDEEKSLFQDFKTEMIREALWSKLWLDRLDPEHLEEIVDTIYLIISYQSGLDVQFGKDLQEFMETDYGFLYGQLWFALFGKTPSEIAKLPETDVQTVNTWFVKWLERVKK